MTHRRFQNIQNTYTQSEEGKHFCSIDTPPPPNVQGNRVNARSRCNVVEICPVRVKPTWRLECITGKIMT